MPNSTNSRSGSLALLLIAVSFGGCHRQTLRPVAAPAALTGSKTFVDLEPGWRLTLVTPLRRDSPNASWQYGQPTVKTGATNQGLNITLTLDPATQFGFEQSQFEVLPTGLRWQQSIRNLEDVASPAPAPILALFPPPARPARLRLLFLTRASDKNYNTALLIAPNPAALEAFTARVRENPDQACQSTRSQRCIWIPPGVAARPEKPASAGAFMPVL